MRAILPFRSGTAVSLTGLLRFIAGGLIAALLLLPFSPKAASASLDKADDSAGLHLNSDLQGFLTILEDKDSRLTIDDVAKPSMDASFIPYKTSGLAGTMSRSTYWVRLDLYNDSSRNRELLLELSKPQLGRVTLYQFDGERRFLRETLAGRSLPFNERGYNHRNFIFNLPLGAKSELKLYFKVQTETYLQLPMKLWDSKTFVEREQRETLLFGMYYGIMFVMAVYNVFLFISIRDRVYLYYVLFIVSFAVMQAVWDGFAYQFLWPGSPAWEVKSNPVFIVLTGLFACVFSQSFLSVRKYSPKMSAIMRGFIGILVLSLPVMALLTPAACTSLAVYLASASILLCLAAIGAVRFRIRSVFFYIAAWVVLFAGSLLNILAAYKLIPLDFWSLYSMRFGSVAETILLSLALADRFNSIKHEKLLEEKQGILLKNLHETTKRLTSTHDLDKLMRYALTSLSRLTHFEHGFLTLSGEDGHEMKVSIGWGAWDGIDFSRPERDPFFRRLIVERRVVLESDQEENSPLPDLNIRTRLGIPIMYHDRPLGLIVLYSEYSRRIQAGEQEILRDFAGQVGISIENVRLFSEMNRMASMDGLTGVYNRSHFLKLAKRHLAQCRNTGKPMSLIMVDIDHFKHINDRYGHLTGDKVIQETVKRLAELAQPRGIIGRYGGEEFVLILPGVTAEQALRLAEIMRKTIAASPLLLGDQSIGCTISLGVSSLEADISGITALIDQADQALYRAKESGRNCVMEFKPA